MAGPADRDGDPGRAAGRRVAEAGIGAARRSCLIGAVAARRETIAWLERRPLHGRSVVVTRARAQASGLAATPCARWAPRSSSCRRSGSCPGSTRRRSATRSQAIHSYALVCLTSPNGARLLFEALAERGRDARALANATVAAIGPGTAAALAEHGDHAPTSSRSARSPRRWSRRWPQVDVDGRPVLVARAAEARDVLPDALRERGAEVDVVALYETVAERPDPEAIEAALGGRLRHLHLVVDGPQLRSGASAAASRPSAGWSRSAR